MASCAARRTTLPVTTNTPRVSSLCVSDANDSLDEAAFTAAVAVGSEATLEVSSASKTVSEAPVCKASLVLRAGTLAARRKLKCGSLRLDVSLGVDGDHDVADLDDCCDGSRGVAGANDDHFSFETPPHAMLPAAAVASATSPTVAWSSRGRQFRKSSSASSAPLSVVDGSALLATAAALLAAAAFPRAASAGAAFNKPPRSPLASLTMISPSSPPLGAQQLSPDAARHADDPRGAIISHKPQCRRRQGHQHHHHPAESQEAARNMIAAPHASVAAAVRQLSVPQAAARKLAELARGGLLSPATHIATTTASILTTNDNPRRIGSVTCKGSTAPSTPTGLLTTHTTSSSTTGRATRAAAPSGGSAVTTPIAVVRLSSRVGFVNWRHLPHRPGTAPHPASPHSASPGAASRPVVTPCGSSKSDSRRQSFTLSDSHGVVGAASCGSSGVADQLGDSGDGSAVVSGPRRVTGSGDEIAESGLDTDGGKAGRNDNFHNEDDNNEASNWATLLKEKPRNAGSNSGHLTAAAAAAAADDDDSDADVGADDAGHESATPAKLPVRFLPLTHDMGDEELFWRASMVPLRRRSRARGAGAGGGAEGEGGGGGGAGGGGRRSIGPAKVALLFYSAGTMPFAPLWARWLEGHEDRVSVYVLTDETKIDKSLLPPIFRGRFVPDRSPGEPASADSKTVHMSTVDGMRRLLANALLDFSNERFVTICELCIPIHNFTFIYSYLISPHHSAALPSPSALFQPGSLTSSSRLHLAGTVPSAPRSYIPSNDVSGEGGKDRFNPNCFEPMLGVEQWRKGGQWIGLTRRLAVQVISDSKFYDKFAACCVPVRGVFPACFPSEHYLPSIIPILVDLPPVGDFGPFVDELWAGIGDGGGMGGGGRRWGEAAGGGGVGLRGSGEDLANWSLVFEDWWTQPNSGHAYVYNATEPNSGHAYVYNATELTPDLVSFMRHCRFGNLCHRFAGHFHPSAMQPLCTLPRVSPNPFLPSLPLQLTPDLLTPDLVSLMRHCHFGNLCHLFAGLSHLSAIQSLPPAPLSPPAIFPPFSPQLTPDLVSLMRHCHFGNLCHLFAGHFHPSALSRALSLGPKLGLWEARSDER
ncbi:unnamed protein product [Closterium sp. Naga37s-1]|nr:unnamed protein product [Closterium sp. Naga37s-1]